MENAGSITIWLEGLRAGRPDAIAAIWQRFYGRMVRLAQSRLRTSRRRLADEEDVASAAFDAFVRAIGEGRFPRLDDRDDLWQALIVVTERQAIDQLRAERAEKRGGGKTRGESVFGDAELPGLDGRPGDEPPAALVVQLADDFEHRLHQLGDDLLRQIARLKLEGYETVEVAEKLGMAQRTIERKLALIRQIWDENEEVEAG